MSKYFCADCNQAVDDVMCPICGGLAEDLRFDEGSPDGRVDRYDESLLTRSPDSDQPAADQPLPDDDEDEAV